MPDHVLYNCWPDCAEPDWLLFDNFEIHGMVRTPIGRARFTRQAESNETPEFHTVFGHYAPDSGHAGLEAITDTRTMTLATAIVTVFTAKLHRARTGILSTVSFTPQDLDPAPPPPPPEREPPELAFWKNFRRTVRELLAGDGHHVTLDLAVNTHINRLRDEAAAAPAPRSRRQILD